MYTLDSSDVFRVMYLEDLQPVDQASHVAGAKSVVDIHHGHVAGAAVEHPEESSQAIEARAVAYAGRNSDHRTGHQTAYHARQGALHPRADYHDPCCRQPRAALEEAMDAGHADVVNRFDLITHHLGGDLRFLRDGNIARARAHNGN